MDRRLRAALNGVAPAPMILVLAALTVVAVVVIVTAVIVAVVTNRD